MNSRIAFSCLALAAMSTQLFAGDVTITVVNGSLDRPQPLKGASVEVAGTAISGTTDGNGRVVLPSVTAGPQRVVIRGPRGFGERAVQVAVQAGPTDVPAVLVSRRSSSIAHVVTLSSGAVVSATEVESLAMPGARISLPAGTTVMGAASSSPEFAIYPLETYYTDVAFPPNPNPPFGSPPLVPQRLIALEPAGVQFGAGVRLRLPNTEELAVGLTQEVWGLQNGAWNQIGVATVGVTGEFMELDVDLPETMLLALDTVGPTTNAALTLSIQDGSGAPVTGALVSLNGAFGIEGNPGDYALPILRVPSNTPLRALVRAPYGSLTLNYLTAPVLPGDPLNRGAPVVVQVVGTSASLGFASATEPTASGAAVSDLASGLASPPDSVGSNSTLVGPLALARGPSSTPKVSVEIDIQGTSVGSPTNERFLPVRVELGDFDSSWSVKARDLKFEIFYDGVWRSADLSPKGAGDSSTVLHAPEAANEYLFVLDRQAEGSVLSYLHFATPVRARVTVESESGETAEGESPEIYVQDDDFKVLQAIPADGAAKVFTDQSVQLRLSKNIDPATAVAAVSLTHAGGSVAVAVSATDRWLRVTPLDALATQTTYTLTLATTLAATTTETLDSPFSLSFATGDNGGLVDTDSDGIPDAIETALGLNPASGDSDGDGIDDFEELYVLKTDPNSNDTDGDGTLDGADTTPNGDPTPTTPPTPENDPANASVVIGDFAGPTDHRASPTAGTATEQVVFVVLPAPVAFSALSVDLELGPGLRFVEPFPGYTRDSIQFLGKYQNYDSSSPTDVLNSVRATIPPTTNPYTTAYAYQISDAHFSLQPGNGWTWNNGSGGDRTPTPTLTATATNKWSITGSSVTQPILTDTNPNPDQDYSLGELMVYGFAIEINWLLVDPMELAESGVVLTATLGGGGSTIDWTTLGIVGPGATGAPTTGELTTEFSDMVEAFSAQGVSVNLPTGEVVHQLPLFAGQGPGLPVSMAITYRSYNSEYWQAATRLADFDEYVYAPFGQGWSSAYTLRLLSENHEDAIGQSYTDLHFQTARGRRYRFKAGGVAGTQVLDVTSGSDRVSEVFGVPLRRLVLTDLPGGGYELGAEESSIKASFDSQGRLTELRRRDHGRPLTFAHSSGSVVITDSQERETTWTLDGNGQVTQILEPTGNTWDLVYVGGSLVRVSLRNGPFFQFGYEPATFQLAHVIDATGLHTRIKYREEGPSGGNAGSRLPAHVVSRIEEGLAWTDFTYTRESGLNEWTLTLNDVLSRTRTMAFTNNGNNVGVVAPGGYVAAHSYSGPNGGPVSIAVIHSGMLETTSYFYTSKGQLDRVERPDSSKVKYTHTAGSFTLDSFTAPRFTTLGAPKTSMSHTSVANAEGLVLQLTYENTNSPPTPPSPIPDNGRELYLHNADGDLVSHTDPLNVQTTYTLSTAAYFKGLPLEVTRLDGSAPESPKERFVYDRMGRVVQHTGPQGELSQVSFTTAGAPDRIVSPDGKIVLLTYDPAGRLLTRQLLGGPTTSYQYDGQGNLASEIVSTGETVRYVRNPFGQVVEQIETPGEKLHFSYDGRGNLVEILDPDTGAKLTYERDPRGRTTKETRSVTDPGEPTRVTDYVYDEMDRPIHITYPEAFVEGFGPYRATLATTYTEAGLPKTLSFMTAPGTVEYEEYEYDRRDRPSKVRRGLPPTQSEEELRYDDASNVIGYRGADFNFGGGTQTAGRPGDNLQLDALGRPKTIKSNGQTPQVLGELDYDLSGRVVAIKKKDSAGDLQVVQRRVFDTDSGLLSAETSLHGERIDYLYDDFGRILKAVNSEGTVMTVERDGQGRMVRVTTQALDGGKTQEEATYNALGQLESRSQIVAGVPHTTAFSYDSKGRLKEVQHPIAGRKTEYTYNDWGQIETITAPKGNVTTYTYDAMGRQKTISTSTETITYEYDAGGNLKSEENGNYKRTFTYDSRGRVTRLDLTEKFNNDKTRSLHAFYNDIEWGALELLRDDENFEQYFTYTTDQQYLHTITAGPQGASPTKVGEFSYDSSGRVTEVKTTNSGVSYNREYDASGRLKVQSIPNSSHRIEIDYDPQGRKKKTNYLHLNTVSELEYDGLGRLKSEVISESGVPSYVELFTYDEAGNRASRRRNEIYETYSYNAANELTTHSRSVPQLWSHSNFTATADSELGPGNEASLVVDGDTNPNNTSNAFVSGTAATDHEVVITFNAAMWISNLELYLPTDHGLPQKLVFDYWDQTTSTWKPIPLALATGGKIQLDSPTYFEPMANQVYLVFQALQTSKVRITQPLGGAPANPVNGDALAITEVQFYSSTTTTTPVDFDLNGNMTQYGSEFYSYDGSDRVANVAETGVTSLALSYGPSGNLLKLDETGPTPYVRKRFLHNNRIYAEYDGSDSLERKYIEAAPTGNNLASLPLGSLTGAEFFVPDGQGNTHQAYNDTGGLLRSRFFSAFGEELQLQSLGTPTGLPDQFGYRGRAALPNTNLVDMSARKYHKGLGRFMSPDPAGLTDGLNRYSYVHNDPVNNVDPSGTVSVTDVALGALGVPVDDIRAVSEGGSSPGAAFVSSLAKSISEISPRDMYMDFLNDIEKSANAYDAMLVADGHSTYGAKAIAVTGVLSDQIGGTAAYQALSGNDFEGFMATGDMKELSWGKRLFNGAVAVVSVFGATGTKQTARIAGSGAKTGKILRNARKPRIRRAPPDDPSCFVAGTLVSTNFGPVPIEEVRPGDLVWARNEQTGEVDVKRVVRVFEGWSETQVELQLRNRASSGVKGVQTLVATPEHPFFVPRRGWTAASALSEGDLVSDLFGDLHTVEWVRLESAIKRRFNLEIEDWHTYFVAGSREEPAIWVHNICPHKAGRKVRQLREGMGLAGENINHNPGFKTVTIQRLENMPLAQFNRKVDALIAYGNEGLLYRAASPVARNPSITRAFRQNMIKRIWSQFGKRNKELANRLIDRVTKRMQPDHVWELQLGGPDVAGNLRFLDSFTNWHIGTQQIRQRIRSLPVGTRIQIKKSP